jgi:hypothetical protein
MKCDMKLIVKIDINAFFDSHVGTTTELLLIFV